jgi:hypothetical protein
MMRGRLQPSASQSATGAGAATASAALSWPLPGALPPHALSSAIIAMAPAWRKSSWFICRFRVHYHANYCKEEFFLKPTIFLQADDVAGY